MSKKKSLHKCITIKLEKTKGLSVFKTEKEILHLQVWQFDQYLTSRKPQWKPKNVKIFNILRGNKWQGKIIYMYDYNHYVIICIIIILYVVIIIVNIIKCILKWGQNKYFLLVETLNFPPGTIREISKGYVLVSRKTITHGISENHEVLGKEGSKYAKESKLSSIVSNSNNEVCDVNE